MCHGASPSCTESAAAAYRRNPVPWIIGGAAVAVIAVGLVAWAVFSRDD